MSFKCKPVPPIELTILMKTIVKRGNEYGEFIVGLEMYLSKMFPTSGFGEWTSRYMIEHMLQISELIEEKRNGETLA